MAGLWNRKEDQDAVAGPSDKGFDNPIFDPPTNRAVSALTFSFSTAGSTHNPAGLLHTELSLQAMGWWDDRVLDGISDLGGGCLLDGARWLDGWLG